MTDTTTLLADLYARRTKMEQDIANCCEPHGPPHAIINDMIAKHLPALNARIAALGGEAAPVPDKVMIVMK
jgi:hypothetical protein